MPRREQNLTYTVSEHLTMLHNRLDGLNTNDPRIRQAIEFIESCRPMQIGAIAKSLNLSASRFRHLFKRELGISPARYSKLARLQRANELLKNSFLSVKEVSARLGGIDTSHLARDYKALYGYAPSQTQAEMVRVHSPCQPFTPQDSRSSSDIMLVLPDVEEQSRPTPPPKAASTRALKTKLRRLA